MRYEDVKDGRARAATVARMKKRDEGDAARLRERGWMVQEPDGRLGTWTFVASDEGEGA